MSKQQIVFTEVEKLYANSNRDMGKWMWKNHVQWVANKAIVLAKKYGADADKVYAGALLHDLGDVWMERDAEDFDTKGEEESKRILSKAGFSDEEIKEVLEDIVKPHSCYPDNLPVTIEGRCLATADAMFHLVTDFFPQFGWMNLPKPKKYSEWISWVTEKIDRDLNNKIFFEDEKQEAMPYYKALKKVYVREIK